ncbi:hypothetical protein ACTXJ3_06580 [Brachybacterium paraconglomeratum]|uniref:hypothetical protein n=1 Tax=Brachybacterium paraconglomeratum TaxID=173362 RepID=UPI003FCFDB48
MSTDRAPLPVPTVGDARPIVEEFARAARFAAVTATRPVDDLSAQLDADRERLARLRRHALAWRVLPLLVGQPIVTVASLRDVLEVPAMSAQRALGQLAEAGILHEATGRTRNRGWQHLGLLAILDDDAEQVRRSG